MKHFTTLIIYAILLPVWFTCCPAQAIEVVTKDIEVTTVEDIVINRIVLVPGGELLTTSSIDAKIAYIFEEIIRLENIIDELATLRALVETEVSKGQ